MFGPFSSSRFALILRRWRGRFGISAPKVAVRTHVPLHWRLLATIVVTAVALALAGWTYDAGRRFAGFDRSESEQEINTLRSQLADRDAEVAKLRGVATASASHLQIERTTLDQLTLQVRTLEDENVRLKEELAVFENLARGEDKEEGIAISRLRITPDGNAGVYRYSLLVSQNGTQRGKEFRGSLQFVVTLQQGGENAMIVLPRTGDPEAIKFSFSFKNFRRLDGFFRLPPEAKIRIAEVRVVLDGTIKAAQRLTFQEASP